MTTQVNEKYVLTEEEKNMRDAMDFLKGFIIGCNVSHGKAYTKINPRRSDSFREGLELAKPRVSLSYSFCGYENHKIKYKLSLDLRRVSSGRVTIAHIIHNRLRHDRPHTSSWESDQKLLTDFKEERYYNLRELEILKEALKKYNVSIPGLESE